MAQSSDVRQLEEKLDGVLKTLIEKTGGSRSTLRIDDTARGWNVDFVCAEYTRPGIKSLRGDGSINQRAAETVKWMAKQKRNLVQPDLLNADPPAPPALLAVYAAKAQMLGPLLTKDGHLAGWISVHYVDGRRDWTAEHVAALDSARAEVQKLTGIA